MAANKDCTDKTFCNFIPVFTDEPCELTESLIGKLDSFGGLEIPTGFSEALAQTRSRRTIAMACTKCGKSVDL